MGGRQLRNSHSGCASQTYAIFPAQRRLLHGLSWAGWAAALWMSSQLFMAANASPGTPDSLQRPVIAAGVLAAVVAANLALSVALVAKCTLLGSKIAAGVYLTLAFSLYVADGWVFEPGHVFASQIALASSWPLVAVLAVAVIHGPYVGLVAGAAVPTGRIAGAAISGADLTERAHVLSFASSITFYVVAGLVVGTIAAQLKTLETDNARYRVREEVGRELHDGVLQTLALIARRTEATAPDLSRLARDTDRALRRWLWGTDHATNNDLLAAVRHTADQVADRHGIDVTVASAADADTLADIPAEVTVALAGAAGELLTNVAKHAGVASAHVFVDADDQTVTVSVRDHGIGYDTDATAPGAGMTHSVRGRLAAVGATVEVRSSPSAGTEAVLHWMRGPR
jgi:signal transduction histidine kinase